jgi:hypothetical protein
MPLPVQCYWEPLFHRWPVALSVLIQQILFEVESVPIFVAGGETKKTEYSVSASVFLIFRDLFAPDG